MPLSTYKNLMENQFSILKFSSEVFMQEPDFKPISMKKYFNLNDHQHSPYMTVLRKMRFIIPIFPSV